MKANMLQSRGRETSLEGVSHEFITHPLVRGSDEDPWRQWLSRHGRVEPMRFFQLLEDVGQLRGHIHAPDLARLGRSDLPAHNRSSHFNEVAEKVEISPL